MKTSWRKILRKRKLYPEYDGFTEFTLFVKTPNYFGIVLKHIKT